jgi:glycine/D-amino acid oxidase-like deaminating enzyme
MDPRLSNVKPISYWLDTAPKGPDYTAVPLPDKVDVVVVGGGLTGLSAAIHIRRKGASVAVLERATMAFGASGRNGGMATTGLTTGFLGAVKKFGLERAKKWWFDFNDAITLIETLVNEEKIDCDFSRPGKLNLAYKPKHYESYARLHDVLEKELGLDTLLIPKEKIHSEIGSDYYHGGIADPRGAGLHVGKFTLGLARVADGLGAQLRENANVKSIKKQADGTFAVTTNRGVVIAKNVAVCTDGYTGGATRWLQRRIIPVGSFIIGTEPLPQALCDELLPTRRMASDSKEIIFYFRISPDNRMLFGGRARFALSGPESDLKSCGMLLKGMHEVFPQLDKTRIDYAWGGEVGLTWDRLPHAGQRNGVWYSIGYNGHGVQMATYMGKVLAEMLDGHPEANPWRDLNFQFVPGHFGPPWFLPLGTAYYNIKDRWG